VNERKTKPITRLGRGYKPLLYSRLKIHRGLVGITALSISAVKKTTGRRKRDFSR